VRWNQNTLVVCRCTNMCFGSIYIDIRTILLWECTEVSALAILKLFLEATIAPTTLWVLVKSWLRVPLPSTTVMESHSQCRSCIARQAHSSKSLLEMCFEFMKTGWKFRAARYYVNVLTYVHLVPISFDLLHSCLEAHLSLRAQQQMTT
jgi:hypothetical protein